MRKILLSLAIALTMVIALTAPATAASNGSVTVALVKMGTGPDWDVVGSLVLNTTGSGKLNVDVNVDIEPDLADYDVVILVFYRVSQPPPAPPDVATVFRDVLNTNTTGQGNAHVSVDINPPPANDCVWVIVLMSAGLGSPEYSNMPPSIEVPLKPAVSKGAIKVDLVDIGTGPNWDVVGSLVLNTAESGKLNVEVNVNTEPDIEGYDILVFVFYGVPPPAPAPADIFEVFPGVLNTNAMGQGNTHISVDINPPPTNENIWVIVLVNAGPLIPKYFNMPPSVVVPLK
jgi:hypothetical protein